jgi:hypothetical protein
METNRKKYQDFCTIGQLKKFIEKHNLSDDTHIVMQRVEDRYFIGDQGWNDEELKKKGEFYHKALIHNQKIESGYFLDKENFPNLKGDEKLFNKYTEDELDELRTQYYPCWCPVFYDDEYLYLNAHY